MLNGSSGTTTYQVGANVGDTISINLTQGVRRNQIGQVAANFSSGQRTAALTGRPDHCCRHRQPPVTVGASVAGALPGQTAGSAYAKAQAINAADISGLTASATNTVSGAFDSIVAATNGAGVGATNAGPTSYALNINGVDIYSGTGNVAARARP